MFGSIHEKIFKKFEKFCEKGLTFYTRCGIIYTVKGITPRRVSEAERKRL